MKRRLVITRPRDAIPSATLDTMQSGATTGGIADSDCQWIKEIWNKQQLLIDKCSSAIILIAGSYQAASYYSYCQWYY